MSVKFECKYSKLCILRITKYIFKMLFCWHKGEYNMFDMIFVFVVKFKKIVLRYRVRPKYNIYIAFLF